MKILIVLLLLLFNFQAFAQTSNGRATSTNPSYSANQSAPLSLDLNGNLRITGTTVISSGSLTVNQGTSPWIVSGTVAVTQSTSPWVITSSNLTLAPTTVCGLSTYFVQPTASDNHAVIKNGAGQVYKISITNNSSTINYIRLYDAGTGFNGCNSATNLKYKMAIVSSASSNGAGFVDSWETGMSFSTGISICVTSGYATNDTTNATASAIDLNIGYK